MIARTDARHGRVALITGGGGGMGRAIAERFLARGHVVVLADRSREALDNATSALGDVSTVTADVTSVADCERMVATAVRLGGRLDVLVNTAGVWVEGNTWEMTEES
jgi:NAD(P)-dependent dehydrogenase (short-subunit alcohol dehydrogenase family)